MLNKILRIGRKIIPKRIFKLGQPLYHFGLAVLANIIYKFPGRKIRVIGVTGTNGKSTTCNLIVSILEEAGYKVGLTSTTTFQIGNRKWDNLIDKTTAGRFGTIKMIREMVKEKCDYAVIEVSSHALSQFRVWGVPFDVAILTNVSHDHLDYHKTFEEYIKTKEKLFLNVARSKRKKLVFPSEANKQKNKKTRVKKFIILNHDDTHYGRFNKYRSDLNISFSTRNKRASVLAKNIEVQETGASFDVVSYMGSETINLKLTGLFNVYNALGAIACGISQNIDRTKVKKGLERVARIPGRLEVIRGKGLNVVLDYAHTPDALENIYSTVRQFTKGNLIAVFGATGDRDREKRPKMGAIAAKMCDICFVTDEEPGDEDPKTIIEEIIPGVLKVGRKVEGENFFTILDRKRAIERAIACANSGDTIVISGIGHQKYRMVKGVQEPWDERTIVEKALS